MRRTLIQKNAYYTVQMNSTNHGRQKLEVTAMPTSEQEKKRNALGSDCRGVTEGRRVMVAGLPESRCSAFALRRAHFHALGLPNRRTQLLDQCRVLLEFLDPFFFLLRDVEAAIPNVE